MWAVRYTFGRYGAWTNKKNKFLKISLYFLEVFCYNNIAFKFRKENRPCNMQIWFIGRTLASQAEETGSTPAICLKKTVNDCLFLFRESKKSRRKYSAFAGIKRRGKPLVHESARGILRGKEQRMISSTANAQIKYLVKLQEKGAARREDKVYVCEGRKMFGEVLTCARESIVKAYFAESFIAEWGSVPENMAHISGIPYETVADHVFGEISRTVTPQGVLAVVRQPEYHLDDLLSEEQAALRLLLLENLRDPGNLGTIMRTAEGAGISGVILSRESVDMFNPKVIRSTMGAIYRMPFVYVPDLAAVAVGLRQRGIMVCAAHLEGSVAYDTVEYPRRTALMVGNEANGLSDKAAQAADLRIRIPMEGEVESLNAAVAAAVLMYETYRQERAGKANRAKI